MAECEKSSPRPARERASERGERAALPSLHSGLEEVLSISHEDNQMCAIKAGGGGPAWRLAAEDRWG